MSHMQRRSEDNEMGHQVESDSCEAKASSNQIDNLTDTGIEIFYFRLIVSCTCSLLAKTNIL